MESEERKSILALPVTTRSWIVLKDYFEQNPDEMVFKKIITEYYAECPLKEMVSLFEMMQAKLDRNVLDRMFRLYVRLSARK